MLLPGHTRISRAINYLYPLEIPIYEKKADDEFLENSGKQGHDNDDKTATVSVHVEKKAQQAICQLLEHGAATIFLFPPGMS